MKKILIGFAVVLFTINVGAQQAKTTKAIAKKESCSTKTMTAQEIAKCKEEGKICSAVKMSKGKKEAKSCCAK